MGDQVPFLPISTHRLALAGTTSSLSRSATSSAGWGMVGAVYWFINRAAFGQTRKRIGD
jgi:hypothetical protein